MILEMRDKAKKPKLARKLAPKLQINAATISDKKIIVPPCPPVVPSGPAHIGFVERISPGVIEGWAIDRLDLSRHLSVRAMADGQVLGVGISDIYREHVHKSGAGDGRYGFRIAFDNRAIPLERISVVIDDPAHPFRLPLTHQAMTEMQASSTPAYIGLVELIAPGVIKGWVIDRNDMGQHLRVNATAGGQMLGSACCDLYRKHLHKTGVGTGRYGFQIEFETTAPIDDITVAVDDVRGTYILPLMPQASTALRHLEPTRPDGDTPDIARENEITVASSEGTMAVFEVDQKQSTPIMPGLPPVVECRMPVATSNPKTLSTAISETGHRKLDVDGRLRHAISRSDYVRYRRMEHFGTRGITASVLSITDSIRKTGTLPSRFLTDSMIAAWLLRKDLQQRFQQLDEEVYQYALLAWFLCVRPIEEGLGLSCEPTSPILTAMSKVLVAEEPGLGAGCTALMLAVYCYVASHPGSGWLAPPQFRAKDIVIWFFCEGAYHLRVSHAIPQNVRGGLAVPRLNGHSLIVEWVARCMPAFDLADLAKESGPQEILAWLDAHDHGPASARWRDLLRESLIVEDRVRFDHPPDPVLPPVCKRLRDAVQDKSELLLIDGEPEYMCAGGNGERLLMKGEWYPTESAFVWSRAPISAVLFCIAGGSVEWARIGLVFDQSPLPERGMKVMLNHNTLWTGTIGDVSSGELILACTGRCLAHDAPNLLQIEVDGAFVPSEQMLSSDQRRLGIGLKRIWIQRAKGLSE